MKKKDRNLKPGQLYTYRGRLYRLRKRFDGCKGCCLDNPVICPGIVDARTKKQTVDCTRHGIIFTIKLLHENVTYSKNIVKQGLSPPVKAVTVNL